MYALPSSPRSAYSWTMYAPFVRIYSRTRSYSPCAIVISPSRCAPASLEYFTRPCAVLASERFCAAVSYVDAHFCPCPAARLYKSMATSRCRTSSLYAVRSAAFMPSAFEE